MANISVVSGRMTKFLREGRSEKGAWMMGGIIIHGYTKNRSAKMFTFFADGAVGQIALSRWAPGQVCVVQGYLRPECFETAAGPRFGLTLHALFFEVSSGKPVYKKVEIPDVDFVPPPSNPAGKSLAQVRASMPDTFEKKKPEATPAPKNKTMFLE